MTRAAAIFVLALSPVCSALAAQTQGAAFFKAVRDSVKISRNSEPLKIARNSTIPAKGLKISVPAGELLGVAFSNGVSAVAVGPAEFSVDALTQDASPSVCAPGGRESHPSKMAVSVLSGKLVFSASDRLERSEFSIKLPAGAVAEARARAVIADVAPEGARLAPIGGTARIKAGGEIWDVVKDENFAYVAVSASGKAAKPVFERVYSSERRRFSELIKSAEILRGSTFFKLGKDGKFSAETVMPKTFFSMPARR